MPTKGFRITRGKGFHIGFDNGYTVSVQFGPANYCSHYDREIGRDELKCGEEGSPDAECAIFGPDGNLLQHRSFDGDTVEGYMTPLGVLKLLNWAAKQKA